MRTRIRRFGYLFTLGVLYLLIGAIIAFYAIMLLDALTGCVTGSPS